jgi:membrane protease YdiL (CAAX protease family)
MTDLASVPPGEPARAEKPARLGVWESLGWALLAIVVAQAVLTAVILVWFADLIPTAGAVSYTGVLVALVALITNPIEIGVLAVAARWRTGRGALDYLGLVAFRWRDLLIGALVIVALAVTFDLIDPYIGVDVVPAFETDVFSTVRHSAWLLPVAAAVVLIGPIGEEVVFRGFLFRGWVRPGVGGAVAVAIISLLWAAMHLQQYPVAIVGQIFIIGLVLGWMRWRSGSTWLTIVLHVLVNFESTVETMLKIAWSGH